MQSTSPTMINLLNDLELRLKELQTIRISDESTLNNLESILNETSNHLNTLVSTDDSELIVIFLPSLLHIIFSLVKICPEKSHTMISSRDKFNSLFTMARTLQNQIREYLKTQKLQDVLKSTDQRQIFDQLRLIADSISNIDLTTTCICLRLIIKVLFGIDDHQQTQRQQKIFKIENFNNDFIVSLYRSVLRCLQNISEQYLRNTNKELPFNRMSGLCFQMITRLIQNDRTLCETENYHDFLETIINAHIYLELNHGKENCQLEFFNQSISLQETLQYFLFYSMTNSSKLFFDEFFLLLTTHSNKYACFIVLLRVIEAFNICLTKQTSFDLSIGIIDQLIRHLFSLIDYCQIPLTLPVLLPQMFHKTPVEYKTIYDTTYFFLMKLFHQQSMQTIVSSMTKLIEDQTSILSISNQLASELILQAWLTYHQSNSYRDLYGLFLAHLLRSDSHTNFIHRLLIMPNNRSMKYRTYEMLISSNFFHRIEDLFVHLTENQVKECTINSTNCSLIYPTNIEHLYSFVRLFQTELSSSQIQYTIDTCIYSIQQFLSLPILTESTCEYFLRTIKVLVYLPRFMNEHLKCLLGQLTQIFTILDDQTGMNIRLELLHLFINHLNLLNDNDLGRLLDFILTYPIESNRNSIAFHLACLNLIDSLRQRQGRSPNLTDLIIQLIVRYGNQHQDNHILKAHLMRIFMAYASNSNNDSLITTVKSQCITLRASIDGFEKSKQILRTTNERYPYENIMKIFNSITRRKDELMNNNSDERELKFYQTILDELELQQCSIERQNSNAMQED